MSLENLADLVGENDTMNIERSLGRLSTRMNAYMQELYYKHVTREVIVFPTFSYLFQELWKKFEELKVLEGLDDKFHPIQIDIISGAHSVLDAIYREKCRREGKKYTSFIIRN